MDQEAGAEPDQLPEEGSGSYDEAEVSPSPGLEPYVESELGPYPSGVLERLDWDARAREQVVAAMLAIIEESGPISLERLGRRLVKAYGRTRLVDQRRAQLRSLIPENVPRDREEGFCWPHSRDPLDWTGFRTSEDIKARPLIDIALLEIANAMAYVAASAMGIGTDELFRQTYKLFGGSRLTEPVRTRLADALRVGLARERLVERAGVVTAAKATSQPQTSAGL